MSPVNAPYRGSRRHHPRWHRERMPIFWWLGRASYIRFIVRELTSLAVAWAAVLLVAQVWALAGGVERYGRFVAVLGSPPLLALNGLAFAGLIFHSVTWLNLAPKALVVRVGGHRLPDAAVVGGHYAAWAAASALVAWLLLGS